MALGEEVEIAPHATVELAILTTLDENRTQALILLGAFPELARSHIGAYRPRNLADPQLPERGSPRRM